MNQLLNVSILLATLTISAAQISFAAGRVEDPIRHPQQVRCPVPNYSHDLNQCRGLRGLNCEPHSYNSPYEPRPIR